MSQQMYSPESYQHKSNQHYMVEHNKQLKCICNLCQCGRHSCPRKPIKGDYQTTYTREYKKIDNVQPTGRPTTYRYQDRHYSQDVLKTSYQQDYDKKQLYQPQTPLSKSRLQMLGQKLISTQVPFNGTTTYKDQYQPYKIKNINDFNNPQTDILSPLKSMNYPSRPAVKFQGISSYKSSYLPPPEPKRSQGRYPISNYYRPPVAFSGSTSYNDHYKPFQIQNKKQQIYDSRLLLANAPQVKFDGTTSYNDHYPAYQLTDNSRISMKSNCKLDQIRIPAFNYINDQEHVYYDQVNNKFV